MYSFLGITPGMLRHYYGWMAYFWNNSAPKQAILMWLVLGILYDAVQCWILSGARVFPNLSNNRPNKERDGPNLSISAVTESQFPISQVGILSSSVNLEREAGFYLQQASRSRDVFFYTFMFRTSWISEFGKVVFRQKHPEFPLWILALAFHFQALILLLLLFIHCLPYECYHPF